MSTVNWEKMINDFSSLNILVIGDAMIDSYIWGDIERISPEAPIPIVKAIKYEKKLGGAANVALNIKSLGAKAKLMSVIGNNDNGLLQLMQNFDLWNCLSHSNIYESLCFYFIKKLFSSGIIWNPTLYT